MRKTEAGQILVTGATGTVGRAVAEHLVRANERVVSGVQDPHNPGVTAGTDARKFDFFDRSDWDAAFKDVDRLFLMRPPAIADVRKFLFPVIDEAMARQVKQIVFLSLQGVQFNTATPHHAVEEYLRSVKAPYTFLRPNFFMQNLSTVYRDDIRQRDEIYLPAGASRTAFIDARDIGRVAAVVFRDAKHLGKAYTLSGEQALGYLEAARIMSAELGRTISYARPSSEEYLSRLRKTGSPEDYIAVQKMLYRIVRLGISSFPNRAIRRLTGRPATTFRTFARDYRAKWVPEYTSK